MKAEKEAILKTVLKVLTDEKKALLAEAEEIDEAINNKDGDIQNIKKMLSE